MLPGSRQEEVIREPVGCDSVALPRGGVPVAAELSSRLHVPVDVWLVCKFGVPGHEELVMGAIAAGEVAETFPSGL
jgi:predicted phosphoribosyltransferase